MNSILRKVLAVIAGLAVGVVVVMISGDVGIKVYPIPAGVDPHDVKAVGKAMASMPVGALLFVLGGWLIGTLAGAWTATSVGRSKLPGAIIGSLLFAGAVATMFMFPHPVWFQVAAIVVFIVATWLGTTLGGPGAGRRTA